MKFESYRAKILFAQEHKVVKPKPRRQSPFEGLGRMTYYSMATDFDFDEPTDYGVPISTVMQLLESGNL